MFFIIVAKLVFELLKSESESSNNLVSYEFLFFVIKQTDASNCSNPFNKYTIPKYAYLSDTLAINSALENINFNVPKS